MGLRGLAVRSQQVGRLARPVGGGVLDVLFVLLPGLRVLPVRPAVAEEVLDLEKHGEHVSEGTSGEEYTFLTLYRVPKTRFETMLSRGEGTVDSEYVTIQNQQVFCTCELEMYH